MTGVKNYLINVDAYSNSFVTFGDGAKGEIKGIGRLAHNGLPKLDDVLLVKGLTANLISISQLCDQGLKVNFTRAECLVSNDKGEVVMRGVRSKNNCYLWVPQEQASSSSCLVTKEDKVRLCHQKIKYSNSTEMKKSLADSEHSENVDNIVFERVLNQTVKCFVKNILKEHNVKPNVLTLYYQNLNCINISKNSIQHSKTRDIDVYHHVIMDLVEDVITLLEQVVTNEQLAGIPTKALVESRFEKLRGSLGICTFEKL
jgi:hypothetical protein